MSDEALNAHLDWLDKAQEQGDDYETWLEKRVTQLEGQLRFEKQLAIAHSGKIAALKRENKDMKKMLKIMGVDGYTDDALLTAEEPTP